MTTTAEKLDFWPTNVKHSNLVDLPWEWEGDYPPGVHGIASTWMSRKVDFGPLTYGYKCYCGETFERSTGLDAFHALIAHAGDFRGAPWWPYGTTVTDCDGNAWLSVAVWPGRDAGFHLLGMHDFVVRPIAEVVKAVGELARDGAK